MKVILSWSGQRGQAVARLLSEWIGQIVPAIETMVSAKEVMRTNEWSEENSDEWWDDYVGVSCANYHRGFYAWTPYGDWNDQDGDDDFDGFDALADLMERSFDDVPLEAIEDLDRETLWDILETISFAAGHDQAELDSTKKRFEKIWPQFYQQFVQLLKDFDEAEDAMIEQSRMARYDLPKLLMDMEEGETIPLWLELQLPEQSILNIQQLSGALKNYYKMKLHQRLVERSERIIQKRMASRAAFLKRRLLGGEE